jgi:hypothetical protein
MREAHKKFLKNNIYHSFLGLTVMTVRSLLPLYLYVQHLDIQFVGAIMAAVELTRLVGGYTAKFLIFKWGVNGRNASIIFATALSAACLTGIILITGDIADFILVAILGFTSSMIYVTTFGAFLKYAAGEGGLFNGVVWREFYISIPKVSLVAVFVAFLSWPAVFAIGAISEAGILITQLRKKQPNTAVSAGDAFEKEVFESK